jgi:hypothetical protein
VASDRASWSRPEAYSPVTRARFTDELTDQEFQMTGRGR